MLNTGSLTVFLQILTVGLVIWVLIKMHNNGKENYWAPCKENNEIVCKSNDYSGGYATEAVCMKDCKDGRSCAETQGQSPCCSYQIDDCQ